MISHFLVELKSIGITPPFAMDDRRARLEFARHYGVPSPLIDFSFSPYVALFFAFDTVRPHVSKEADHAAIRCLNISELAGVWRQSVLLLAQHTPRGGSEVVLFYIND